MKKYFEILKQSKLFHGIEESDLEVLLSCLGANIVLYEKGQNVFFSGVGVDKFGILLSGQLMLVQDSYYGDRTILEKIDVGNLFGESFACAESTPLLFDVVATAESEVLFIHSQRLAFPCPSGCGFHSKLIQNMLSILSMKNIALTRKIEFTSRRTTREKILSYLSAEATKSGSSHFSIPFNRQEMADYLSVERSAMSAELSKLRCDGVIKFHKNNFELLR